MQGRITNITLSNSYSNVILEKSPLTLSTVALKKQNNNNKQIIVHVFFLFLEQACLPLKIVHVHSDDQMVDHARAYIMIRKKVMQSKLIQKKKKILLKGM